MFTVGIIQDFKGNLLLVSADTSTKYVLSQEVIVVLLIKEFPKIYFKFEIYNKFRFDGEPAIVMLNIMNSEYLDVDYTFTVTDIHSELVKIITDIHNDELSIDKEVIFTSSIKEFLNTIFHDSIISINPSPLFFNNEKEKHLPSVKEYLIDLLEDFEIVVDHAKLQFLRSARGGPHRATRRAWLGDGRRVVDWYTNLDLPRFA